MKGNINHTRRKTKVQTLRKTKEKRHRKLNILPATRTTEITLNRENTKYLPRTFNDIDLFKHRIQKNSNEDTQRNARLGHNYE